MAERDRGKAARVLELCRKLKPVIGAQADRIWLAYVAENESGKQQLLDYLEILAAQQFQGSLDDLGPGLLPPKAEAAAGEYALGTVAYNNRPLYPFGLRENELIQHVGIFGRSGAGKTNIGFLILQQLIQAGKPVMVIDWKRGYRDLVALPGFEDTAVYTVGRSVAPLSFNPLIPPPGTSPQTWLKKLIAVITHSYFLGDGVIFLLQEAIDGVYEQAGVYTGTVERWPTMRDVYEALKQRPTKGREAGWMSSAIRALSSLCFGDMDALVNQGHSDIAKLLERSVILELDALNQSEKVFVAQCLLLWIHHCRMTEPTRETLRHVILLEEAHHLLSGERQSLAGGQSVMELTFREIREFGESLFVIDQCPSTIAPTALANLYAVFCFNLKHRSDVTTMSQAMMLEEDEKAILGNLQLGEAVVRLQGRSVKPFMIHVPEFHIKKGSFTDNHVIRHMTQLGLLAARDHPIQRGAQPAVRAGSSIDSGPLANNANGTTPEQAFLSDIETFPDAGVAERYRRLGLSVRQGQRVKQLLVAAGRVQEQLKITPHGKLRVLRLTD